jgi:hypothetical protein
MRKTCVWIAAGWILLGAASGWSQGERVSVNDALDRALKTSSLTVQGKPFHAVMEIGTAGAEYSGRVEVWWLKDSVYKVQIGSPKFSQVKVVNGDRVWEKDEGVYYPRWLENFVLAILDPVPDAANFKTEGPQVSQNCLKREHRPGGITDELTFEVICLAGSKPHVDSVLTFSYFMQLKDYRNFGTKAVAHEYETRVLDFEPIIGKLTALDDLTNSLPGLFDAPESSSQGHEISTRFISTATEESMVETAPTILWPSVREGKTDGYMIVYARTDRTGQVRETAKHNSDQAALEDFGREQALKYKFKPLVVDGVPMQMEMPLVLHFTSRIENPIPELDDSTSRKLITGCRVPDEVHDPASAGQKIVIQIQVTPDGHIMTLGGSDRKIPVPILYEQFRECRFGEVKQGGVPTAYHANVIVTAR